MVKASIPHLGLALALVSCATANEYFPTLQIISGHAVIVGADARGTNDRTLYKDLSAAYSGYLEGDSDQRMHGIATVFGTTKAVYGQVITVAPNQTYELSLQGLPPDLWTVRTDPGDGLHYTLVAVNPAQFDITGDSIPESVRVQIYLEKQE